MRFNLRFYKRWDFDLIALLDAGYPVVKMMQQAIISYAKGEPLFYYIDELSDFDPTDKKQLGLKLFIPDTEKEAIYLMTHSRPNKNYVAKMILRNSLVQQNIGCCITDPNLAQLININNEHRRIMMLNNVIPLSSIKEAKVIDIKPLNKTIVIDNPKSVLMTNIGQVNPYANMVDIPVAKKPPAKPEKKPEQRIAPVSVNVPTPAPVVTVPEVVTEPITPIEQTQVQQTAPPVKKTPSWVVSEVSIDDGKESVSIPNPDKSAGDDTQKRNERLLSMFDRL